MAYEAQTSSWTHSLTRSNGRGMQHMRVIVDKPVVIEDRDDIAALRRPARTRYRAVPRQPTGEDSASGGGANPRTFGGADVDCDMITASGAQVVEAVPKSCVIDEGEFDREAL